ncbi:hypothetical protein G6F31_021479 [Rhizopus arrhizus]|nr:hypothetical protein G6F31_021479 [Rhizopus arrhizus]
MRQLVQAGQADVGRAGLQPRDHAAADARGIGQRRLAQVSRLAQPLQIGPDVLTPEVCREAQIDIRLVAPGVCPGAGHHAVGKHVPHYPYCHAA